MKRTEMYTNGQYLTNNPGWDESDAVYKAGWIRELLDRNNYQPVAFTEAGCGSGNVLMELVKLYPSATSFTGYDISPQAIEKAKSKTHPSVNFHLQDFVNSRERANDLLMILDVIEHVEDYYSFLEKLKERAGNFLFHIPLDLSCRTLLKPHVMLQQREAVGHIHYFSRDMVKWMLADTGFTIVDWMYTRPVNDFVPGGGLKQTIKKQLRNASFGINKNLSVDLWGGYSMMILAK